MKKLLLPICIVALVALLLSATGGKEKPAADDAPRFTTVSEAAFSMRSSGSEDVTSRLVGSYTGENSETLIFNGAGEVKRIAQNLSSKAGTYSLLQSADGAAILRMDLDGTSVNYAFVIASAEGAFTIRDADGHSETFTPVP